MEVPIDEDSFLLRNPERLQICGLDGFPNSRWLFKEWLRADLDAADRFADDAILTDTVILRIKLLKLEDRIEIEWWFWSS